MKTLPKSDIRPEDRLASLAALKNEKMARSAHAYVRGSTAKFYEWIESAGHVSLPKGPPIWICGDCHVGNLGPVANSAGALEIQIRDLDQSVIGNPAHDLVRLGLSLAMSARGSDLPGITTAHMLEHMIEGYQAAIGEEEDTAPPMPEVVKIAMRRAAGRSWKHLANERIEGVEPVIPLGKAFWPLLPEERDAIVGMFGQEDLRALVTSLRSRDDDAPIKVADAAYWRKGCSSLGLQRYAVLLEIGNGKDVRHCLMDVKEAVATAAPRYKETKMPRDNGERVVEGAKHLSPFLGKRMSSQRLLDRAVFIRELLPQDLKFEIESLTQDEAIRVAEFLAQVVGKAHARQMSIQERRSWVGELGRNRSKNLDAPSWLWSSIVDLVGAHEVAYLEHCRRYAFPA